MLDIRLNFHKRLWVTRFRKKFQYHIPEKWEEMTPRQSYVAMALLSQTKKEEYNLAMIQLIPYLAGITGRIWDIVDPAHKYAILERLNAIKIENLPAEIQGHSEYKGYQALSKKLGNATNREYALADEYFTNYIKSQDTTNLHALTAILYSSQKNGKRITINSRSDVHRRSEITKKWPAKIHLAAFMFFGASKKYIHDTYGEYIFSKDGSGSPNPFGLWGIYMTIAESRVFGNFNQVLEQNVHETFMYMVQKKIEEIKNKSKAKTHNP